MEVPGRQRNIDDARICQPCQRDGDSIKAEAYCENCDEFICTSCINAHRKIMVTKKHVIKYKDEMPTTHANIDPCTELCDVHKNEIVKYYCPEHDVVGCGDCIVLTHTSCKIKHVADVSHNYDESDEFLRLNYDIDHLHSRLSSYKKEIQCSLEIAENIKADVVIEIKHFRKEVDEYLDQMEKEMLQEVESVNSRDVSLQEKLLKQCEALAGEIEDIELNHYKDRVNTLFVTSKRVQNRLLKYQETFEEMSSKSEIHDIEFTSADCLNNFMENKKLLGNLTLELKKFPGLCFKRFVDTCKSFDSLINIKTAGEGNCSITGMAILSEDEIICADGKNNSIKILNHCSRKITSTCNTSSFPGGIATINSDTFAITLPNENKILFLRLLNEKLFEHHSLNVRGRCCGIDFNNGIMAVSFSDPPAVQMMNIDGTVLFKVNDTDMLSMPLQISLSKDNQRVFVSDCGNDAVFEYALNGQFKTALRNEKLGRPAGIAVTKFGSTVVCYPNPTTYGMLGMFELGDQDINIFVLTNVNMPFSILISEEHKKMFVSEYSQSDFCNYIVIFDLK